MLDIYRFHDVQVINQLLLGTDWGELEYLIIDMPPGRFTAGATTARVGSFHVGVK